MALYEEKKRLKETQSESRRRRQEKQRFQSKNVPNFKRLQKNFEAQLCKMRELKNPTVPNAFKFSGTKQYSKASGKNDVSGKKSIFYEGHMFCRRSKRRNIFQTLQKEDGSLQKSRVCSSHNQKVYSGSINS